MTKKEIRKARLQVWNAWAEAFNGKSLYSRLLRLD
jgi:hypothetical protein